MPVRNMLYDSLNYSGQVSRIEKNHKKKKDKLSSAEYLSGMTGEEKFGLSNDEAVEAVNKYYK
ncbi:MAG: hypothetical protein ACLSHN_11230 [Eubacterium sp.]|uniref:hypothetical protein n=1 Tax=Eubacterium sp. TaxID=142586 RepID=UPI0015B0CCC9|nr:hypothetical protein [Eubacterium sp.]